MAAELKVVDASAIAAVLFNEPSADEVAERLSGCRLCAPPLLELEVASVCVKKIRRQPESEEGLRAALSLFGALDLHFADAPVPEVVELALLTGLTPYDAAYLFLARALDVELVTLDRRLARVAQGVETGEASPRITTLSW